VLNLVAVSLSFGSRRKASKKVETTFVVSVNSLSLAVAYLNVATPAFSSNKSSFGRSLEARAGRWFG